jgi:hypothetical protein
MSVLVFLGGFQLFIYSNYSVNIRLIYSFYCCHCCYYYNLLHFTPSDRASCDSVLHEYVPHKLQLVSVAFAFMFTCIEFQPTDSYMLLFILV